MKSHTWGREGDSTQLQYSYLENPMGGGAWQAAVHEVAKSQTRLSDFTFTFHFHTLEKEMATHSSVLAWRIPGTGEPAGLHTESDTTEGLSSLNGSSWGGGKLHISFSCQLEYILKFDQDKDSFWRPRQFLYNSHPSLICYPYMVQPALYYSCFL